MHQGVEICRKKEDSALPDDLLVHILSKIPTKDVVTSMVLSKRWNLIWTMVYNLDYTETNIYEKSVWNFLDKSLQLHKAPVLGYLSIELGQNCLVDADVGKCVSHAVAHCIHELNLECNFLETVDPTCLPKNLYKCKTLVYLTLTNKILVDVPSSVCLPSLRSLDLIYVVSKDEDTHVMLLSSYPVLKDLVVVRNSYKSVMCMSSGYDRNLVIDSLRLSYVKFLSKL